MAKSRREHFRKTRRSRLRDLRQSPTGVISMLCAVSAAVLAVCAVVISYRSGGDGEYTVGTLGGVGFVLAAGALALGILCRHTEEGIRPLPVNTGIRLGGLMSAMFAVLFIAGLI